LEARWLGSSSWLAFAEKWPIAHPNSFGGTLQIDGHGDSQSST
jgi:hypothetical protein